MLQIRNPISAIRFGGITFLKSRPRCGASGISRPGALSGKAPRLRFGVTFWRAECRAGLSFSFVFLGEESAFPSLALPPGAEVPPPGLEAKSRRRCPDLSGWRADRGGRICTPGTTGSPYDHTPGMAGSLGYHPYAAPLGSYPYGDPAYRKNATRDATATLKAWLNEHRKNPYPTKGEKIMLAIITKMTLTQVSTWFANARRRLKKENKMTWTPRNRSEDEEEEENIDLEKNDEDEPQKPEDKGDPAGPEAGGAEPKAAAGCERLQGPCTPAGKETEGSLSDSDFKEPPSEGRLDSLPGPTRTSGPSPAARPAEDQGPHYPPGAPAPGPHPATGELPPGPSGPSVIHSPPPPPPQAVLAKPKLWSLAEIATSSDKVKDGGGGSESSPCPPCAGPIAAQALGGSRASPAPAPSRSPSAQCPFPGGTVLSRPLYYTAPFYPGYTNYGSFGHLHGHPGPGPGPTAGPGSHFNGLNQTVLNRADALAKDPKILRSQSQLDLCKDSPYELKKGMSDI
ncbi:iroquois-class homeodomain protein IRX-5 isoform X2 [Eptesicus fuscus]|uniref:iroquois-class homeodomain protein IRX-5 isoform X2 n=1 Tax=Eptesicus fuscus TaxID=29078 RepID=UPI002403DC9A|nr:iroquois-class homeodomain protein IRX-5 isoform X2 [Eptesicus fuscus]